MQNVIDIPTEQPLAIIPKGEPLQINRAPEAVLGEAQKAAAALKRVIESKPKKVIFNGETYLEFEDWQTLGRFYGITSKIVETKSVDFGDIRGFEARAVALSSANGQELSAADAMCLSDERSWKGKPLFMLRSMAQTRACAKALRNVLAWVVVLAGYRPTPAEEMQEAAAIAQPPTPRPARPRAAPVQSEALPVHISPGAHYDQAKHATTCEATLTSVKAVPFTNKKTGLASQFFAAKLKDAAGVELEACTFDSKLADKAEVLSGQIVQAWYVPGHRAGKFELVGIEPADLPEMTP